MRESIVGFVMTVSLASALMGCDALSDRYTAEVGYYADGETKWDLWGDYTSLDECRSVAIERYNFYVSQQRAHTWSCLLKNGKGGYASRHR